MPPKRVKLILNPMADMGNAWRLASDLQPIVEEFGTADWAGTVYPTHATELAQKAAEDGYDTVVAVGGDGTVHEIVNGLMTVPSERRPTLGVVPMGSGNDFATAVGLTESPPQALKRAFSGTPKRFDLGLISDEQGRQEYFDNTMGIGFDTTATLRSHKLPLLRGFLMYFVAVIQTIIMDHDAPMMQFTSDEEQWERETLMLVVCNGPNEGGGFIIAPDASNNDGIFHYTSVNHVSRAMMFRLVPEFMRGTHGRFSSVYMGTLKKLALKSDKPMYIHTDGEIYAGFGTDVREINLEIIPEALEVVV